MGSLVGCIFHILHIYIIDYLTKKRLDPRFSTPEVNEVDIYKFNPFELPGLSESQSEDQVWYFYSEPYYKNASSKKPQRARAAGAGYWKSTGKGCEIKDRNCNIVGSKRTLVFYLHGRKRGRSSKETKTEWVMHEFCVKDSPHFKRNFVLCYVEKQPNKGPSVSTPGDGQPSPSLASDSVNHVVEDIYTEVQSQDLPSHPLISDTGNHVIENTFSEAETQQTAIQNLVSDSSYPVEKNTFSMVKSQVLRGQDRACDPANHVPENIVSPVGQIMVEPDQPLSSHNMVFDWGNHIAANASLTVEPQPISTYDSQLGNHVLQNNFSRVEPLLPLSCNSAFDSINHVMESAMVAPPLPFSYNMTFDSRNHIVENAMVAPQLVLPSSHDMVYDSRNHVAENTFCMVMKSMPYFSFQHQLMVDLQLPSGQYLVSGSGNHVAENMVESSPPAEFGAFDVSNALNHSSFSAPQLPINPEQGSCSSSYSNSFSKDCAMWSSQFDGEHEDVANSQPDFEDENPHEGTGQTLPAGMDNATIDMISNELLY